MDRLDLSLQWLLSRSVDWELVLRFLDVLIWPAITVVGLAMVRPGRIVSHLLENGGELGLGPATMKFAKQVEQISSSIDEDEATPAEPGAEVINPLQEAADPYTTILNGWGKVVEGLEEAVRRGDLEPLEKRSPMDTVLRMRRKNLIGKKLERNIQALWDFRNRVVRAGSRRVERLGLSQLQADEYYSSADRVRRGIIRALAYRESKGIIGPVATAGGAEPRSGGPLH
jgi:hypothetical protein